MALESERMINQKATIRVSAINFTYTPLKNYNINDNNINNSNKK